MHPRRRLGAQIIAASLGVGAWVASALGGCSLRSLSYLTAGNPDAAARPADASEDTAVQDGVSPGDERDAGDAGDSSLPADSSTMVDTGVHDAPSDSSPPSDAAARCPDPSMVNVGSFCIDSTELSLDQYQVFVSDTSFDAGNPLCAWKTSYGAGTSVCGNNGPLPVDGIDWCDAFAYCAWAGKRLCGKRGSADAGGGPLDISDRNDPLLDEWYYACTAGLASQVYPYGPTFNATACNGMGGPGMGSLVTSGSLPSCMGGFQNLFDMSGNVFEWEDSCDDAGGSGNPGADYCATRGGSWVQGPDALTCADPNTTPPFQRNNNAGGVSCGFGIRCCSDLVP